MHSNTKHFKLKTCSNLENKSSTPTQLSPQHPTKMAATKSSPTRATLQSYTKRRKNYEKLLECSSKLEIKSNSIASGKSFVPKHKSHQTKLFAVISVSFDWKSVAERAL